jgi:hypothetical protein
LTTGQRDDEEEDFGFNETMSLAQSLDISEEKLVCQCSSFFFFGSVLLWDYFSPLFLSAT